MVLADSYLPKCWLDNSLFSCSLITDLLTLASQEPDFISIAVASVTDDNCFPFCSRLNAMSGCHQRCLESSPLSVKRQYEWFSHSLWSTVFWNNTWCRKKWTLSETIPRWTRVALYKWTGCEGTTSHGSFWKYLVDCRWNLQLNANCSPNNCIMIFSARFLCDVMFESKWICWISEYRPPHTDQKHLLHVLHWL